VLIPTVNLNPLANTDFAPVALFAYNRAEHTKRTLQALEKNRLADDTDVYVFSDGPKRPEDAGDVANVRAVVREGWKFRQVRLIERDRNWGLAENVIDGVTKIVNEHGRAIVLEDDLETSPYALTYFNDALRRYADEDRVMEISGYMYPVKDPGGLPESFFFRVANSWGWATWKRAWKHFNPDIEQLTKDFSREDVARFSIDRTENFWRQVKLFKAGRIDSWAIRWYLSVFNQNGLVLYPRQSMVQNIGMDGSGTHFSQREDAYSVCLAGTAVGHFPSDIEENREAYEAIRHFYAHRKGSLFRRLVRYAFSKLKIPLAPKGGMGGIWG